MNLKFRQNYTTVTMTFRRHFAHETFNPSFRLMTSVSNAPFISPCPTPPVRPSDQD